MQSKASEARQGQPSPSIRVVSEKAAHKPRTNQTPDESSNTLTSKS